MSIHVHPLIWLALAGALGSLARYFVGGWIQNGLDAKVPWVFPWGTLAVNTIGCFLFGVVWPLAEGRMLISGSTRMILLTGFMGAFTTYSTYTFETSQMMLDGQWFKMAINMLAQHILGFAFFIFGYFLGRQL